jgi:hypothetical protein
MWFNFNPANLDNIKLTASTVMEIVCWLIENWGGGARVLCGKH